ncbi:hypothetical protein [Rhizobium rhizoryzae]|uniref:hypothetical protein n=1 Tax=Rhizobium rhizoryzae TaxID=451876 RepID=UPI0028AFF1AC|nr:hypothetical protein [Rhizobium rhizoryzae]
MLLVTTPEQVIENIHRYNKHCHLFKDLMPRARAWYALKSGGEWLLAPSKVIGYQDLKPKEYLARNKKETPLDGRITESVLQNWADLIEEGDPRYEQLHNVLNGMCAKYGKKPNSLARISVIQTGELTPSPVVDEKLVELLAAVFKSLSPAQKSAFHKLTAGSLNGTKTA